MGISVIGGDIVVIAICLVIGILLKSSYVSRTRTLGIYVNIIVTLVLTAIFSIVYNILLENYKPAYKVGVYVIYIIYHGLLFDVFSLFALYITEVTGFNHKLSRITMISASSLIVILLGVDIILTATGVGYTITDDGFATETRVFKIGYLLYVIMLGALMFRVRHLVYKRVIYGFYGVMLVSVLMRFGQQAWQKDQSYLTTMTFVFPLIAMLYLIHSNPYNVMLGSVDAHALEDMVRNLYSKKAPFIFMTILLTDLEAEGKEIPKEIQDPIRKASANFFKGSYVFQIGKAHMLQIIPKRNNQDYERRIKLILDFFQKEYDRYHLAFKITIGESIDEISQRNEYVNFIKSVEQMMPVNTIRKIGAEEIEQFNCSEYILQELTDIYKKKDLDDPRVLTFCQPVYNLRTGQFDTAEALMRLKLERIGIVSPNQFIPVAESHGYIHVLTDIILNKTCREIKHLMQEGFLINRISVNMSVLEMKSEDFCNDIMGIINRNGIPSQKIALELTESSSEADFAIMNEKIEQLRQKGISFYLDDFGTGYSNMERIMELPFDIIKFDRSLVLASETGERSEKIVKNLAHLFKDMDYSILYEGVENSDDEDRCRGMFASYLQGFKYSRPIPIEQLRCFLQRESELAS